MSKDDNEAQTDGQPVAAQQKRSERSRAGRRRGGRNKEKVKVPTKIVMRHLPPTMTEEEFLEQIDPLPAHDSYYFVAADWSLGFDATCRAYITLKDHNDVFLFRDRFDGYVFVDSRGAEYTAIVEFAPFQGLAKNKSRRSDAKENTIEEEPHYQQFLEKLEADRDAAAKGGECKLEFSLDRKKEEKITSTPLLQYLANKKEKRREEAKKRVEEKRKQRDEEKDMRRQILKPTAGGSKSAASEQETNKKEDKNAAAENNDARGNADKSQQDERKSSRAKRRAERDQRRREEHEIRKRDRDRLERERKQQAASGRANEKQDFAPKKILTKDGNQSAKAAEEQEQSKPHEHVKREGKRYSEKREKERARNRRDAEQQQKEANKLAVANSNAVGDDGVVNDNVKNFLSAAAVRATNAPDNKTTEVIEKSFDVKEIEKTLRKMSTTSMEADTSENQSEQKQNKEQSAATDDKSARTSSRRSEERRIRNKDRPSIAIYQPKARLRKNEDCDAAGSKDLRSNPTSDCESVKQQREEQPVKKVSRYSERRNERRANREKQQRVSEGEGEAETEKNKKQLRKSKSCEENTADTASKESS